MRAKIVTAERQLERDVKTLEALSEESRSRLSESNETTKDEINRLTWNGVATFEIELIRLETDSRNSVTVYPVWGIIDHVQSELSDEHLRLVRDLVELLHEEFWLGGGVRRSHYGFQNSRFKKANTSA